MPDNEPAIEPEDQAEVDLEVVQEELKVEELVDVQDYDAFIDDLMLTA